MKKAAAPSILVAVLLFAVAVIAEAQQTGKIFRIGFLEASTESGSAVLAEPFRQELSKLGWIAGKNIIIEYRFAEGQPERERELAAELVRLKVDLIVVAGVGPALAAKSATTTTPIVMASAGDPVAAGLVASLARPGGNVTGFSALATDLSTKRLEVLKDAVPNLVGVGVLRTGTGELVQASRKDLPAAALSLKLKLEEIDTPRGAKGLESAFQTAKQKQVGAILMPANRRFVGERKRIVELAGKHRLPVMYPQKAFVDEGGLMSYGADLMESYRRVAYYVDSILKGTKPADLPVEQPMKFDFIINLKTAKQIGLTIPPEVLARATKLIK